PKKVAMSTTNRRRSSKERFWRRLKRQWRRSGLSNEFCSDRQISEPNFYAWRPTIAQRDVQAARWVPVRVVPDEGPPAGADTCGGGLELLAGRGRVLRIGPGFDGATLARLLALLVEDRP